jgi:hypothetical protein
VGILFGMLHVLFVSANWFLLFPFLKLYIWVYSIVFAVAPSTDSLMH